MGAAVRHLVHVFEALRTEWFVDRSPGPRTVTRAGFRTGIEALVAAFPDFKWAAEDIVTPSVR